MTEPCDFETNRRGEIDLWQSGEHNLLYRPRTRYPAGASLFLSHRSNPVMSREDEVRLRPSETEAGSFFCDVDPELSDQSSWRYRVKARYSTTGNLIICQFEVARDNLCREASLLPVTLGLMLRFATKGSRAALYLDSDLRADTSAEYDFALVPLVRCDSRNRIEVTTANGHFELACVSGVDSILLDTTNDHQFFGVMLIGNVWEPVTLLPGQHFLQTITVRYTPKR